MGLFDKEQVFKIEFGTLDINIHVHIQNDMQEAALVERLKGIEAKVGASTESLKKTVDETT